MPVTTDWKASQKVGIDFTDDEWADLFALVAANTPPGERPSYGRFISNTLRRVYREELAMAARQRKELAQKIKGA